MSARAERFRVPKELQYAAAASVALVLSFLLPWYQKTKVIDGKLAQGNVSALGAFTFVEGAILLVAVAVCFLVWARSRQKGFHLPGGDGVAITLAGAWCIVLIVFRMFDQPDEAARWAMEAQELGERLGLVGLIDAYADRMRRLEQRSPTPEWDGVFTAETK